MTTSAQNSALELNLFVPGAAVTQAKIRRRDGTASGPPHWPCRLPQAACIMFFEDVWSERKLMEAVNLNLAYRWYIGYDLDESVPNHSSLTKIRSALACSLPAVF